MYNDLQVKALREAIDTLKKSNGVLKEYCTNECEKCPLEDMCDWEGNVDFNDERLTDSKLDDYVEYYEGETYKAERRRFKEVTGIDPAWYDFNEDRSETWID